MTSSVLTEMGREWYNKSNYYSKSERKPSEAYGCISALYHFFHFNHSYFSSRHRRHNNKTSIDSPSRYLKGLVAPRNSLEMELTEESPLSTNYNENKSFINPVGRTTTKLSDLLVETSSDFYKYNSPRTKTPNVVARLMGIDPLPDNLDLKRSSMISVRRQRIIEKGSGTRSLPESPWIFSPRKSDSDIRRLSLQLHREVKQEELGFWRRKELKQNVVSPSLKHKTVKQTQERVITRRAGTDISNLVVVRKAGSAQNHSELKNKISQKQKTSSSNHKSVSSSPIQKDSKERLTRVNEQTLRPINNRRKKAHSESKSSLYPIPNNQNKQRKVDPYDPLEKKKSKKIPKSNDIFNISIASSSSFSATESSKQVKRAEEPSTICSGQMYRYEEKLPQEPRSSNVDDSTTVYRIFSNAGAAEINNLFAMKTLEEEVERVVAEIERLIVDALILETAF